MIKNTIHLLAIPGNNLPRIQPFIQELWWSNRLMKLDASTPRQLHLLLELTGNLEF
jgi:hypothetical protein